MITDEELNILLKTAIESGASDAAVVPSASIVVEKELADLCNGDPRCANYNLAPSCPPHVSGPAGFKKWQKGSDYSIAVKIDVPMAAMFSEQRREIMQLLHEVVADVEKKAAGMGYRGSRAFAGGSCKTLFCSEHAACCVLDGQGLCRHPQSARPSMSGFGINVTKLMQSAGWPFKKATRQQASDGESMTWVAGLVLIADAVD
jgi:predicted metal-binding protein